MFSPDKPEFSIESVPVYVKGLELCSLDTPGVDLLIYGAVEELEALDDALQQNLDRLVERIGLHQRSQVDRGTPVFKIMNDRRLLKLDALRMMKAEENKLRETLQALKSQILSSQTFLLSTLSGTNHALTNSTNTRDITKVKQNLLENNLDAMVEQGKMLTDEISYLDRMEEEFSRGIDYRDYRFISNMLESSICQRIFGIELQTKLLVEIERMKTQKEKQMRCYTYMTHLDDSRPKLQALIHTLVSKHWK